jgi:hypothetical protein
MKKWLGRARDGYSDATGASVDGSGTVSATTPDRLPAFAETFSGSVSLTADAFAFTVGTNALGQVTVTPPVTIPGALSVTAAGTLTVHFGVRPPAGTYTLLSYGSVAGQGFADWTLTTDGDKPAGPVLLKPTATALNILVAPQGTLIQML